MRIKLFIFSLMTIIPCYCVAQVKYTEKGQAYPPITQHFGKEAFAPSNQTVIRWLGNAGFFINSRGTCIMVDPLLIGFDMPLLIEPPILPEEVPALDAVLITHSDNDHFSIPTCEQLATVCQEYHSTLYVDSLMKHLRLPSFGHSLTDTFQSRISRSVSPRHGIRGKMSSEVSTVYFNGKITAASLSKPPMD